MQEYALSSEEGVALMCLAEALLRIPDTETADQLIAEMTAKARAAARVLALASDATKAAALKAAAAALLDILPPWLATRVACSLCATQHIEIDLLPTRTLR